MLKRLSANWGASAVAAVALSMSLYHLWVAFFGPPDAQKFRAIHLTFVMAIAFLMLPARGYRDPATGKPGILDIVLLVIALAASTYPIFFYDYLVNRMYYVDELRMTDFIFGSALVLLVLEATRRAVGWALPATAAAFLLYTLVWMGFGLEITLDQLYLTTEGIFGIPLGVSATYIVLFILFGALVERSGAGRLFMDFAMSLTGHAAGGPAKVACVTSGLFGSVSGSAVANVMTTGVFTIPLMQRIGYKKGFSGAVEAVASTGGQIMPPIMGAAAFVMAEFLGIGYLEVAAFALFPAILYYVALFAAVHFEAKRTGMVGLPKSELPSLKHTLLTRGHLFLPLVIIIGTLLMGYSAPLSALAGIMSVVPTAMLRKETRKDINLAMIGDALISGAKNTVPVALACACAGIVVGCITLTNLGTEFTGLVIAVSQDFAGAGAGAHHDRRHHPRNGDAHDAGLHRPGRAAGAGSGEARRHGRGGAHVRLLLRDPFGDHAAGGDGGLRGQRDIASGPVGHRLRGAEARRDRVHHPVHVRVRPVDPAHRRVAGDRARR